MGSEAPDRETDPGASQRIRPQMMQNVGYPQQGEQEEQRFEGFPEMRKIEWMRKRKTGKFKFICLPGGGLLKKYVKLRNGPRARMHPFPQSARFSLLQFSLLTPSPFISDSDQNIAQRPLDALSQGTKASCYFPHSTHVRFNSCLWTFP